MPQVGHQGARIMVNGTIVPEGSGIKVGVGLNTVLFFMGSPLESIVDPHP